VRSLTCRTSTSCVAPVAQPAGFSSSVRARWQRKQAAVPTCSTTSSAGATSAQPARLMATPRVRDAYRVLAVARRDPRHDLRAWTATRHGCSGGDAVLWQLLYSCPACERAVGPTCRNDPAGARRCGWFR
jgi:hypothetical protein